MKPMFRLGTCDVCSKETEVGVASLPFAPMSVAFCRECLTHNAYPLWALYAGYDINSGVEQTAQWFQELGSFHEGSYIDGAEVKRLYLEKS